MAKKKRSALADYTVYIVIRVFVCIVQMMPWELARKAANLLAWIGYHVDKRHRKVALNNLEYAYPEFDDAERDQLVRGVYCHFATLVTEIVLIPRKLHATNWKKHIEFDNSAAITSQLLSDRPLLILTGHFGNWELAGYYLNLAGITTYAVARPLDNPFLDRYLRTFREQTGQKVLSKKDDYDRMLEVLASGGILATLGDQAAGRKGLFVDFFGRPASTHKAIALMALEYNVPIAVTVTYKVGEPMRYRVATADVIFPEEFAGNPDAVRAMTERYTSALEQLIRLAPDQYLWLHNRWKHKPPVRKRRAA